MNEHIVIVSGTQELSSRVVASIPDSAIVLAADGGLDHALAAGLKPEGLIGDLDSVSAENLAWAETNATISRHPTDKDRTDTELALAFAAAMHPESITLIGGGDRLDHTIAAIGALGAPALTSIPHLDAWWGDQHVSILHGPGRTTLRLVSGSTLSLIALHGRCHKVTLTGVKWPLDDATVDQVVGLGISNIVIAPEFDEPGGPDEFDVSDESTGPDEPCLVDVRLSSGVLTIFDDPAPEQFPDRTELP